MESLEIPGENACEKQARASTGAEGRDPQQRQLRSRLWDLGTHPRQEEDEVSWGHEMDVVTEASCHWSTDEQGFRYLKDVQEAPVQVDLLIKM